MCGADPHPHNLIFRENETIISCYKQGGKWMLYNANTSTFIVGTAINKIGNMSSSPWVGDNISRIAGYATHVDANVLKGTAITTEKPLSDIIKDIDVIAPGKVMVVTFNDDKQEKLVCQKEDRFSLRFGCFIAIAKHLYKGTYTSEGIEHMATEMSYQIHYVKIVNKAIKNYLKKCEEKAKEKRLEFEKKEIAERKRAKREAYKERRKARLEAERSEVLKAERAEMVDIIAEAIKKSKE